MKKFEMKHSLEMDEKFHQLNIGNIGNVVYWWQFLEIISKVPGDIVECGVGRGRSLTILSALNHLLAEKGISARRKVFAYDSFEGFPEPATQDASRRNPKKGEWAGSPRGQYQYSEEFTRLVLSEAGVPIDDDTLTITKGFFCDSLVSHPDNQPIALLHLDGDLYESYKDVLERLYDQVAPGGILVFDDFMVDEPKDEPWPGARLAVKEFFGSKIDDFKESIGGTYYYIKE
jgi:SAM-dependent methyltransferase